MDQWIYFCITSLVIALVTSKIIIYWLGERLLDKPTERSSHKLPTPRGGGIAIALATISGWSLMFFQEINDYLPLLFLIFLTALMAILGALDDFVGLSIRPRLLTQFILSAIGVYFCLTNTDYTPSVATLVGLIAVVGLVWVTNLYNFMDGINGLAAIQAISTCLSMGVLFYLYKADIPILNYLLVIGFSCIGFLYWNFPNAKIFMGDTGSLFLGFSLGLIALRTGINSVEIVCAWLIMLAVFIVDASYTLVTRLATGQKFYLPHRSHSYQKLALRFGHTKTTLLIFMTNCFLLFPLALLMMQKALSPVVALGAAYAPLIFVAFKLRAGSID